MLAARYRRAWRRWRRPLRWLLQIAVFALGFVVFLPATDDNPDADIANPHLVAAPPIWLIAPTMPLWRAPEHGRAALRYCACAAFVAVTWSLRHWPATGHPIVSGS